MNFKEYLIKINCRSKINIIFCAYINQLKNMIGDANLNKGWFVVTHKLQKFCCALFKPEMYGQFRLFVKFSRIYLT